MNRREFLRRIIPSAAGALWLLEEERRFFPGWTPPPKFEIERYTIVAKSRKINAEYTLELQPLRRIYLPIGSIKVDRPKEWKFNGRLWV